MEITLDQLARKLGARLLGNGQVVIKGVAGIREAGEGEITFLANPKYQAFLAQTRASAILLPEGVLQSPIPALLTPRPYLDYVEVLRLFDHGVTDRPPVGIHPSAVVAPSATLGAEVALGPGVVIGEGAVIGDRTTLMAGTYVGPACRIGCDCLFYPRVVVRKECEVGERVILHSGAVIGDDGFGFAPDGEGYRKIPQIGRVVIEDDVEIGANSTIDRATTGVTRICRGSRLDNLVMVAHNVEIGENSILCAQVGISGSAVIGRHVTLAGQVGVGGHLQIGDNARIGGQAGVTKSLPGGQSYSGYPAIPHPKAQRISAAARSLPQALRELHEMERRLEELERRLARFEEQEKG